MARGRLRIYLGAAPGVGKTYAVLGEAHRRRDRGTDVVIAVVEDHGRARTTEMAVGLERVPLATLEHRGTSFTEMDLDAVLRRKPEVAVVDELAHTNIPGARNDKRWQDVEELLDAGIDVISTVNIQHLASLNDVVEKVTGVPQRETVPDEVVRRADQIELVDMSPEALRRRMAHGNVYALEKVDAALGNYFRVGNLTALRELALLWLADEVEEGLLKYRRTQGIEDTWETRERVVVAVTGGPEGETLLRRGARIAARQTGGDLLCVHVSRNDGLQGADPQQLAAQRALVEQLGGSYHLIVSDDLALALLEFARAENATQLVLGASRRGRLATLFGPGTIQTVVRESGSIDVHLVTHDAAGRGRGLPLLGGGLTRRRRVAGYASGATVLTALTVVLANLRGQLGPPSQLLMYLSVVVLVALIGGLAPALATAVAATALLNWYFTPPFHKLSVAQPEHLLALIMFVLVATAVSAVVDTAARRSRQAARAGAEAELLATLSGDVLRGARTLPALLERMRQVFGLSLVELHEDGREVCAAGSANDGDVITELPVGADVRLLLHGRPLAADDLRVLGAYSAQVAVSLERGRMKSQASAAQALAEVDRQRTSLLAVVGRDLRTPLSTVKSAVSSLTESQTAPSPEQRAELLATAQESLDQLDGVVSNLLDMSRLQAGDLSVRSRPVRLLEAVPPVLSSVPGSDLVQLELPDDLPDVEVDPGLLERVLVNLTRNALRHSPLHERVRIAASAHDQRVELRVVDRGPAVGDDDKERIFLPIQLADRPTSATGDGGGLGLAVARGFVEAMGGTLTAEDTPGGGLTMTVALPALGRDDVP